MMRRLGRQGRGHNAQRGNYGDRNQGVARPAAAG